MMASIFLEADMRSLEEKILKDGKVFPGDILKVDGFINHQIDPVVIQNIADELFDKFSNDRITKVLTVEASGIAIAIMTAAKFGVPMVFAKKSKTKNISNNVYSAPVASYTHGNTNDIIVSKEFLNKNDRVLIVDDFLALGNASFGMIELVKQAGATVCGIGIAIEKGYQGGGDALRKQGYHVESLAIIDRMDDEGNIEFRK